MIKNDHQQFKKRVEGQKRMTYQQKAAVDSGKAAGI
jgi:hypothetical protein